MQTTASVGEDMGKLEPLGAAGRNVRDCRCYRKQFGVQGTAKRPVGLQHREQRRRLGQFMSSLLGSLFLQVQ